MFVKVLFRGAVKPLSKRMRTKIAIAENLGKVPAVETMFVCGDSIGLRKCRRIIC
jgi:hypothetical protein